MPRYKEIDRSEIRPGQRIRVTRRTDLTTEATVQVTTGAVRGVPNGTARGWITIRGLESDLSLPPHSLPGALTIELELADLPTGVGSVVRIPNGHPDGRERLAVLAIDPIEDEGAIHNRSVSWRWTDNLLGPTVPSRRQLDDAEIVYSA